MEKEDGRGEDGGEKKMEGERRGRKDGGGMEGETHKIRAQKPQNKSAKTTK